ncbi:MAG: hypothetical protein AB7D06_08920 [Pedobacter sp.]
MAKSTIRQQLVEKVTARLQTILQANDYNTDLGLRVRVSPTDQFKPPETEGKSYCLDLFFPTSGSDISEVTKRWDHSLDVDIDVYGFGPVTEADISNMIADVFAAVGTDPGWDGLAIKSRTPQVNPELARRERLVGCANIAFKIEYMTPEWQI